MALTRTQKEESVKELVERISQAQNIIVWEYHGTTADEIGNIRTSIKDKKGINKIYKNRLAKIAFKEAGKEEIMDVLQRPNSFLFTFDDDEGSMKVLAKAVKENEALKFKGGYIEGEWHDADSVKEIASLPGKEDLLSMLLSVLQAPLRNLAYVVSQIEGKGDTVKEETPKEEESKQEESKEEVKEESEDSKEENNEDKTEESKEEKEGE